MEITQTELETMLTTSVEKGVNEALKKLPPINNAGVNVEVTRAEEDIPFASFGVQLEAVKNATLSQGRDLKPRLKALNLKQLGANELIGSEGGFLLEPSFVAELLKPLHDAGPFSSRAAKLPIHDGGYLIADFQDVGVLVIDAVEGRADGYLVKPESMHANLIEYLFLSALFQLLRRRRFYTIHASALEKYGRGVLISGNSGRGKTTSIISLLRSGYRYLSDDHPLMRDAETHVEVLPFPTKISVTDATIEFFPELRNAPDHVLHAGWPKRSFCPQDLYPVSVGDCCQLAVILFPYVLDAPHSHLELLPR